MATPQLEKIFFNYILNNKSHYEIVQPYFFRNNEIQFVYNILREYTLKNENPDTPTPKQILDMVDIEDKDNFITKPILKSILNVDLSQYSEKNFILPHFKSWVLKNRLKTASVDIMDETRGLEDINGYEETLDVASRMKDIIGEMSSTNFIQDEDLGLDFDDPENHVQDTSRFKIPSGLKTLDHVLGGGWDVSTLNLFMGETNSGKCYTSETKLNIKNRKTKQVKNVEVGHILLDKDLIPAEFTFNGKYTLPLYDKFIEAYETKDLQVETPNGWVDIEGIGKTVLYEKWYLTLSDDQEIFCADEHIFYKCVNLKLNNKKCDLIEIYTKDLIPGDFIMTKSGPKMIMHLVNTQEKEHMYDLQLDKNSNKQYYTNNILSHNSLWMQNLSFKTADKGYNVLYITLEMSERKVMKRLGSMRLKVPINEYDEKSKDVEFIKKRIENLPKINGEGDLFDKKIGKIYSKFWAAGTATVNDFDMYLQKLKDKKNIDIHLILVDYITLIAPSERTKSDNLYTKGKNLAEGLRALAAKWEAPVISGIQISKDAWNANDITLDSIPESKAIAETSDTFFAIIRTEEMKRNNVYRLKNLKQRDGDFIKSQIFLKLNTNYLTLEDDQFVDQ